MGEDVESDVFKVVEVLGLYCHAVDRGDFEPARGCYHDDAFDDHGLFKGDAEGLLPFFRRLSRSLAGTAHMIGMPWVTIRDDRAWAVTSLLHRMQSVEGEALIQGFRYLDYLERRGGHWKIARRTVVLDWDRALSQYTPSGYQTAWTAAEHSPDDPAVRFLEEVELFDAGKRPSGVGQR